MIEPARARRVVCNVLCLILPLALLACSAPAVQMGQEVQEELPQIDLRSIQDALRDGKPGEQTFEVAAKHLPRLILDESSWRVASGAFGVGEHKLEDYVPHLLEALERKNQPDARDPQRARRAILDALLRLDAEVPARLLTDSIDADLSAVTYLLLVRNPEESAMALRRLHDALPVDNAARWASACALTSIRDKYVAERLIGAAPWTMQLIVDDPGNETLGGRKLGGGHWMTPHGSWPPQVTYHLQLPSAEEPPFPVPHSREASLKSGKLPARAYPHTVAELRVRLLDELLGTSRFAGRLRRTGQMNVTWSDAAAYKDDLEQGFGEMRRMLGLVALQLEKAGLLLDHNRVQQAITFTVGIRDMRSDTESPLPTPPVIRGVTYEKMQ